MKHLPLASSRAPADALRAPVGELPILLCTPPSIFLLDERVFVSLGILKVAAVLEQAGYRVEHLDLNGVENYEETVRAYAAVTKAKIFALTATTPQLPATTKIVRVIREVRPDAKIVLGGPHITLVHSAMKLEKKAGRVGRGHGALAKLEGLFDVLVSGDGESAIFEALRADAPKVVDADELANGMFMSNADYEASPYPARHLVDLSSYRYTIEGHKSTSLIAQLGCPYKCGFCGGRNTKMLRRIRTRSTANIVGEIEQLYKTYGFTGWMAYDDELNVNKSIVELMNAIAALQERLGVEFRLRGFIKAELFTDEQAAAMRRAGFRWLLCGFEGADPRILENIRKNATLDDNTRVMEIAARHDLKVKALMSVGHPGESEKSITAVRDWLLQVKPADFDCTVITTYPGTPYYDEALPNPTLGPDVWTFKTTNGDALHSRDVDYTETADYYKGDPDGGYTAYVFTDHLSSERIVELRNWVEQDVREKLQIPFNPGVVATRYEHSMGQIPLSILRTSVSTPQRGGNP
jgi:anaerobic magnesium-protoporphyrin IX monomethyl ester cyclase